MIPTLYLFGALGFGLGGLREFDISYVHEVKAQHLEGTNWSLRE